MRRSLLRCMSPDVAPRPDVVIAALPYRQQLRPAFLSPNLTEDFLTNTRPKYLPLGAIPKLFTNLMEYSGSLYKLGP